jgi:hypothetical protein
VEPPEYPIPPRNFGAKVAIEMTRIFAVMYLVLAGLMKTFSAVRPNDSQIWSAAG